MHVFSCSYSSGDPDVAHWAVAILHSLGTTSPRETSALFLAETGALRRVTLAVSRDPRLALLAAEFYGELCDEVPSARAAAKAGIGDAIKGLATVDDEDVRLRVCALVMRVAQGGRPARVALEGAGVVPSLVSFALHGGGRLPEMAARALVSLAVDEGSRAAVEARRRLVGPVVQAVCSTLESEHEATGDVGVEQGDDGGTREGGTLCDVGVRAARLELLDILLHVRGCCEVSVKCNDG